MLAKSPTSIFFLNDILEGKRHTCPHARSTSRGTSLPVYRNRNAPPDLDTGMVTHTHNQWNFQQRIKRKVYFPNSNHLEGIIAKNIYRTNMHYYKIKKLWQKNIYSCWIQVTWGKIHLQPVELVLWRRGSTHRSPCRPPNEHNDSPSHCRITSEIPPLYEKYNGRKEKFEWEWRKKI